MLSAVLRSGATNSTWLLALGGLAWAVWPRVGHQPRWVGRTLLLVLAAGTCANLGLAAYRAYAVPRDVMQDIVAAREFVAGRPMHPADMTARMRAALDDEGPRPSLLAWSPELAERERVERDQSLTAHWVQAHPPAMTLATVPFVRLFGVLGTQAAFALIGVAALAVTLYLIRRELWPAAPVPLWAGAVAAAYGWDPVLDTIRLQQPGLVLIALLTAAWAWARRGRAWPAGVAIAAAVSLKLVPGLLLVPLLVQHRRAFGVAVAALLLMAAVVLAAVPWADVQDYRATAATVVDEYATYSTNVSVLGAYARVGRVLGIDLWAAKLLWEGTGCVLVAGCVWTLARRATPADPVAKPAAATDRGFALGMALIPLLSPVAWDHYEAFLILPLAVLARRLYDRPATRSERVGFWAIAAVFAIPDQTYQWAYDGAEAIGWLVLEVGVLEPLRTFAGLALVAWLFRLRDDPPGSERAAP